MKNWLKRNKIIWIGGLVGLIIGFILILKNLPYILVIGEAHYSPGQFPELARILDLSKSIKIGAIFMIIGVLIGFIIQKVRKK